MTTMFSRVRNKIVGKKPNEDANRSTGLQTRPPKGNGNTTGPRSTTMSFKEKPTIPELTPENLQLYYSEPLPAFKDVQPAERQNLFVQKLHLCSFTFNFNEATVDVQQKETKRRTLCELVDYVTAGQGKFNEVIAEDVVFMVGKNLFRTLPPPCQRTADNGFDGGEGEIEPFLDPAWPHLQLVYEFLLRYVVSNETDTKVARKFVDQRFILKLLELFDCEDPRERDYLKAIVHRIYGKFMVYRHFIRRAINNIFYTFVFETDQHNGIAELLEILGSIINGFALPLKDEHKQFLKRALLPLHKPKNMMHYQQQLAYCVSQFVEKDAMLAEPILRALLRYWPVTNSSKEVYFVNELEEILELTKVGEFVNVLDILFKQIAKSIQSAHFQVCFHPFRLRFPISLACQGIRPVMCFSVAMCPCVGTMLSLIGVYWTFIKVQLCSPRVPAHANHRLPFCSGIAHAR
jgi:serine/threonine-protein phosphatase 2A regulatory subunit B'